MIASVWRLLKNRRGATAIEYGLIIGVLTLATLAAIANVGTTMNTWYNNLGGTISTAG
ncbi:MAG TPA: Flp family type IVb pilin [Stellaceae bacterium]|nr:Flp family type IVb pilin [Stellaceae bacterium]